MAVISVAHPPHHIWMKNERKVWLGTSACLKLNIILQNFASLGKNRINILVMINTIIASLRRQTFKTISYFAISQLAISQRRCFSNGKKDEGEEKDGETVISLTR